MRSDCRDVKLIYSDLLLAVLLAPIVRHVLQRRGRGMTGWDFRGRSIEEQSFSQPALFFGNRGEAFDLL